LLQLKLSEQGGQTMSTTAFDRNIVDSHPIMSWRATIAGLLVSFLVFGILLSLGVAMGGVSLMDGASLRNSGIMGAIWMLLSIFISLFVGSYLSGRISAFATSWAGIAQGAVLCSLFIGLVLWQFVGLATSMTRSASSLVGSAVQAGAPAVQGAASQMNLGFNEIVEDNLGDVQLKGEPSVIASGVASRLIRGNPESAKNYLARNSNLTRAQVDQRIEGVQAQITEAGDKAQAAAAGALKVTGWSLFLTTLVGLFVSIAGGIAGIRAPRVLVRDEVSGMQTFRPAHT